MAKDSKPGAEKEAARIFDRDTLEAAVRRRVRTVIEAVIESELEAALGAAPSARVGKERRGYRNGRRERQLTTSLGPTTIAMPRARVFEGEAASEWRSQAVGRYQRRTARVDEAILGVYLAGTNTRRLRGALAPLLGDGPLSKDAISRLVGRLRDDFEVWRNRDLGTDDIRYLQMDGWYPKVRLGRQRVRVPVLVTLGVKGNGERIVVDLRLVGEETSAAWGDVITHLVARGLGRPQLAMVDGNPGLLRALREQWPGLPIQRCTAHKLRNLEAKAPVRLREEVAEDYRRMVYAESAAAVERARAGFLKKWRLRCPAVAKSLEEAGDQLFTFLRFPRSQWKALRTTNSIERINGEFRRRTKTQASLPSHDAVLLLLFGLLRTGHIKLRKLVGWKDMNAVLGQQAA
jgi:putative transposase